MQIRGHHPVRLCLPPFHRRGIVQCRNGALGWFGEFDGARRLRLCDSSTFSTALCCLHRYDVTTPSGFACHHSAGGELPCADTRTPPRQATPATPPQEGNNPPLRFLGIWCYAEHHPVKRSLTPLHRRGIAGYRHDAIAVVYLYWTSPLHRRGIARPYNSIGSSAV